MQTGVSEEGIKKELHCGVRRCQEKGVVGSRLYLRARSLGLDEAPEKRSVQFWNSV